MAISNGFDEARALAELTVRLGWKQPTQAGYNTLVSTGNRASASGRFFEDFHAAVTVQNLKNIQPDPQISDADFNVYLSDLTRSVCRQALSQVFTRPQIIESSLLFDKINSSEYRTIANGGKFCGWKLKIAPDNVGVAVNAVSLLFDSAVTFNLYLYNDLRLAPLKTQSVTTVAGDQTTVNLSDWILGFSASDHQGGDYYIGYFQNDLGAARALDVNIFAPAVRQAYRINGFEATATGATSFDRTRIGQNWQTYGLNLQLSSFRDYTQTIVRSAHLFDDLIGLMMAAKVMELTVFNIRKNSDERAMHDNVSSARIYGELNQAMPTKEAPWNPGFKSQIAAAVKALRNTFFPAPGIVVTSSAGIPYE